jgi:hypothetical protein
MPCSKLVWSLNRHGTIYLCLAVFAAFCVGAHMLAVIKIVACDGHFMVMNQQTINNMALIEFIDSNLWFPVAYAIFTFAGVFFLQMRNQPEWTWWLWSAMLCTPFALYLSACMYIGGKFIF